jgi:threonine synthase
LAPDGGLYIPVAIPSLPENWESEWKDYSFQQLAFAILSLYTSPEDISRTDLKNLIEKSYSTFRSVTITPLRTISQHLHILELFHGPTYAFKDVALQFLGNLFEFFLSRRNSRLPPDAEPETITIVGATSGDTGSAAIYGLRSKPSISTFILHPRGRVSPIQEAQMTTVLDANVHNLAVHGTFDDCQDIVKELFNDAEFRSKYRLGAVNSINWARILAQIVYYFSAYFQARRVGVSGELQFVVPTGNFGDVLAGWYAKQMGLPMSKLGVATNANDILARFWKNDEFSKGDEGVLETHSPAMDIVVSSNFERLLWYLAYDSLEGEEERRLRAGALVKGWMGLLKEDGKVPMPTKVLALSKKDFVADSVSNDQVCG